MLLIGINSLTTITYIMYLIIFCKKMKPCVDPHFWAHFHAYYFAKCHNPRRPHVVFGEAIGESGSGLKDAMGRRQVLMEYSGGAYFC